MYVSSLPLRPLPPLYFALHKQGTVGYFRGSTTRLSIIGPGNFASTGFSGIFRKASKAPQVKLDSIPRIQFVLLVAMDTRGSCCISWFSAAFLSMINFHDYLPPILLRYF